MAMDALDPMSGGGDDWFAQQAPTGSPTMYMGGSPTFDERTGTPAPAPAPAPAMPTDLASAQQAFNQLFPGESLTPQMIQDHAAELQALGFTLRPNAAGIVGKVQWGGANGPIIDVVQGAGSGLNRKQWLMPDQAGGGAMGALGGGIANGAFLQPWTQAFQARDPNQIANDPAYQFQLKQGLQGIERGAASKGTLLTGGTLKALEGYGQGLASTYNDKYYTRDVNEYGMARDNFYQNQDRPFDKLFKTTSQIGLPAALGANQAASGYAARSSDNYTGAGEAAAAGTIGGTNATTGAIAGGANAGISAYEQWRRQTTPGYR